MTDDDLRTRIAAAIESIRIQRDGDAARMADAVIRELKLKREELGGFVFPAMDIAATATSPNGRTMMSDTTLCPHRWDTGDNTDPGYCQCQRWAAHDGAHQCCCGATDD